MITSGFFQKNSGLALLAVLVCSVSAKAQWTVKSTNGPIYYSAPTGVGNFSTATPDGLHITTPLISETTTIGTGVRIGNLDGTARIILDQTSANSYEIDNFNGRFRIYTPGEERFPITQDGKVGIGLKDPDNRLDVLQPFTTSTSTTLFVGQRHSDGAATGRYGLGLQFEHIDASNTGKKAHMTMWYANQPIKVISFSNLGNVGIGTTSPDARLAVNGDIHAKEVRVDLNIPAPDYVFENDYKLMPLAELETYLRQNKHLPEIPSAKTMEEKGVELKEMNMLLLKKVEELTLYLLEMKKENAELRDRVEKLEAKK